LPDGAGPEELGAGVVTLEGAVVDAGAAVGCVVGALVAGALVAGAFVTFLAAGGLPAFVVEALGELCVAGGGLDCVLVLVFEAVVGTLAGSGASVFFEVDDPGPSFEPDFSEVFLSSSSGKAEAAGTSSTVCRTSPPASR
jgi:hypothetical protein